MKDRRESEETCAREGREKTRSDAFQAAEGQDADHGDGERRGAEKAGREPQEFSESHEEREGERLEEIRGGRVLRLGRHGSRRGRAEGREVENRLARRHITRPSDRKARRRRAEPPTPTRSTKAG